ncbi:glycoside hydrolase family 16 protein [Priestia sp. SB1]|uniref:glycoside hydrolase family 16 protein n=1 Tax=Priestia sp. SB1 TaxID=3132359 RepID=UPI00317C3A4F
MIPLLKEDEKPNNKEDKVVSLNSEEKKEKPTPAIYKAEKITTETGTWNKVWEDSFDTPNLDKFKWNAVNDGKNYNGEIQYYRSENISTSNSTLNLTAKEENYKDYSYTSGKIDTLGKFDFKYGRVEIRAKYPTGKGLFPAIWMLPSDQQSSLPEIDMFEVNGGEPNNIYAVYHFEGDNGKTKTDHTTYSLSNNDEYHDYAIEWEKGEIRYYVDNKLTFTANRGISDESMYLIINLAVGGNWIGKPSDGTLPTSFDIDYVKVFKKIPRG